MGSRANYVIRDKGELAIFYSHWGALTVAEDVFWGPVRTEKFIRENEPTDEWLDDVWAEGGIALDKDSRTVTYYYSAWPDREDIREVYEELLADTWTAQGWTTRRACTWQEIASAVGVDPALVTAEKSGEDFDQPEAPPVPPKRSREECLKLVREHLAETDSAKSEHQARMAKLIDEIERKDGPVKVAPGFLRRVPSSRPAWKERLRFALRTIFTTKRP